MSAMSKAYRVTHAAPASPAVQGQDSRSSQRGANDRPPTTDAEASWWIGLTRDQFAIKLAEEQERIIRQKHLMPTVAEIGSAMEEYMRKNQKARERHGIGRDWGGER